MNRLFICTIDWSWEFGGSVLATEVIAVMADSKEEAEQKATNWSETQSEWSGYVIRNLRCIQIVL